MSFLNWNFFWAWLGSFLAASLVAPLVIKLYQSIGWIDDPRTQNHPKVVHDQPVPRGGGLVIAAGIITALAITFTFSQSLGGLLLGALILLISGTLDDRYDINPYLRYVLNIMAALCVILSGIGIDYVTNPIGAGVIHLNQWSWDLALGPWILSLALPADLLALVWIVWNMNAVNWSKGVDGQMPGFAALAAFFIAILSLRFQGDVQQQIVTVLALATSGSFAGLLLWNAYPQKMMPGYAAGSLAGYFLSVLAILSGAKVATVLLLLAIPTVDGLFVISRRIAKGRSPFWGDRSHLHHRMLDAGWSKQKIAVFYWLMTFIFGIMSLQLDSRQKLYAMMASAILFAALVIWFKRSITSSKPPAPDNG